MLRVLPLIVLAAAALTSATHAAVSPVAWCGTDEVTANRVPEVEVSSAAQIRVLYVIPSDAVDNFGAYVSGIATDIATIDQWWRNQDSTRTPRFDRYPFPSCPSIFGALDIGFVRLPNTGASYLQDENVSQRLSADLPTFPTTQKTLVYYDGPLRDDEECGDTEFRAPESGGRQGIAFVFLRSICGGRPNGGTTAIVGAHELIHSFGALPDGAAHPCPGDPEHPCDSPLDVLWPVIPLGRALDLELLDANHDDYYAHSRTWFDLQDSRWLEHLPQRQLALRVADGSGSLTTAIGGQRFDCGVACALQLDDALPVDVLATPGPRSVFSRWTGACAGVTSARCTVTMTADRMVEAVFEPEPVTLRVRILGRGRVASTPAGIACPRRCSALFRAKARVKLTATAVGRWRFRGWSAPCGRTRTCTIATSNDRAISARFVPR